VLDALDFRLDLPRGAEHVLGLLTKDTSFEKRLKVALVLVATLGDANALLYGLHLEIAPELVLASALALVAHDQDVTPRCMTARQLVQRGRLDQCVPVCHDRQSKGLPESSFGPARYWGLLTVRFSARSRVGQAKRKELVRGLPGRRRKEPSLRVFRV
jgi:hypothetical protein